MKKYNTIVPILILLILSAAVTVCICLLLMPATKNGDEVEDVSSWQIEEDSIPSASVEKKDFQPVIDEWTSTASGDKGVYIYDLDLGQEVGRYNAEESFQTASIYKLFVVYEGYRRLESGQWQPDDAAGATGHTIAECLDLAIRESDSECAETMWEEIGREEMQEIIDAEYYLKNTDINNFASTPEDVGKMMEIFYKHNDINNAEYLVQMKDSFLNQSATIYDWRQGLPSGFEVANVYNKVGWDYDEGMNYWNIYNDAAIVEFPDQNKHYVVVVMTSGTPYYQIQKLGQMLEEKVLISTEEL